MCLTDFLERFLRSKFSCQCFVECKTNFSKKGVKVEKLSQKQARRHVTMIFRGSKHISSVSENRLISLLALACSSRSLWGICDAFKIPTFGKVQKILDFFSAFTVAPFLLILIRRQMCITRLWSNPIFEYTLSQCLQIDEKVVMSFELGCSLFNKSWKWFTILWRNF